MIFICIKKRERLYFYIILINVACVIRTYSLYKLKEEKEDMS